jgi:hypothetical protein
MCRDIMRDLERLYTELYGGYREFAEDDSMKEKFVRYSTQIAEAAKLEGKLEIAKNTGLTLRKVKALLKTLNVEQPA